jgi:hypothetical protein
MINEKEVLSNTPKNLTELQKKMYMSRKGVTSIYGRRKRISTNTCGRILYISKKDSSYTNGTIFSETPVVDDTLCALVEEPLATGSNQ